jgi:hypothetical protein
VVLPHRKIHYILAPSKNRQQHLRLGSCRLVC